MLLIPLLAVASAQAEPEGALTRPTYSWVHVSDLPGRRPTEDALGRRRVLEARLERKEGRARAPLLRKSADLLVAASDAVWVAQLRRLDSAWADGVAFELDTADADALRDEALRRYESAIGLRPGRSSAQARLSAGLLRRERRELEPARAHLAAVVEGPAPLRVRRKAAVELGEMEFEAGDVPRALDAYRAAASLAGTDELRAYAEYRIGWCEFNLGEYAAARDNLVRAARRAHDRALAEEARRNAIRFAALIDLQEALAVVDEVCDDDLCVSAQREHLAELLDESGRIRAAAEVRSLEP
ncbi:MAG: hypothetical protein R3F61_34875 [Myxococcota bacterium]